MKKYITVFIGTFFLVLTTDLTVNGGAGKMVLFELLKIQIPFY